MKTGRKNTVTRLVSHIIVTAILTSAAVMPKMSAKSMTEIIADFGNPDSYTIFSPSKAGSASSSEHVSINTDIHMEGRTSSMLWQAGTNTTASTGGQRFNFSNAGAITDWSEYSCMNIQLYSEEAVTFGIRVYKAASQKDGYWHYNLTTTGSGWEKAVIPFSSFTPGSGMSAWNELYSMQFSGKPEDAEIYFDSITLEGTVSMRLEGANPPPEFKHMSAGAAEVTLKLS